MRQTLGQRAQSLGTAVDQIVDTMYASGVPYDEAVREVKRRFIRRVMKANRNNQCKAARELVDSMRKRFEMTILPFELDELRVWLLEQFGGEEKAIQCPYCRRTWINVFSCVIDHRQPASRGGDLGLGNLCPCCEHCNDVKGALGAEAFAGLMRWLETIDPRDAAEIMRRLELCYKLAASRAAMKRKAAHG